MGLLLLKSDEEWRVCLKYVKEVIDGTSTSLQRSPAGPIYIENVLSSVLPFMTEPNLSEVIHIFALEVVNGASGTYFDHHASYSMVLSQILKRVGNKKAAYSEWERVGAYLTAYGNRKDTTIYEIIDSIPSLMCLNKDEAISALVVSQPLADAMLRHTDGRSTKRAPLAWYSSLLQCDATIAMELLYLSISGRNPSSGWPIEEAFHDSLQEIKQVGDPFLLDALYTTLVFEVDHESESAELASERLHTISRLIEKDRKIGSQAFYKLAAKIASDGRRNKTGAIAELKKFAGEHKIPEIDVDGGQTEKETYRTRDLAHKEIANTVNQYNIDNCFSTKSSIVEIIAGIRQTNDSKLSSDAFINALGYRLVDLLNNGFTVETIGIIRIFARSYSARDGKSHPLQQIAEGLERFGFQKKRPSRIVWHILKRMEVVDGFLWAMQITHNHYYEVLNCVEKKPLKLSHMKLHICLEILPIILELLVILLKD